MPLPLSNFLSPALRLAFLAAFPGAALLPRPAGAAGAGAPGVVCRNAAGELLSVELYDLFEARSRRRFVFSGSQDAQEPLLTAALERLSGKGPFGHGEEEPQAPFLPVAEAVRFRELAELRLSFQAKTEIAGGSLPEPPELGATPPLPLPEGCAIESLAVSGRSSGIRFAGPLFEKLPPLHRAALWMHELISQTASRMLPVREMFPEASWSSMSEARRRYFSDTSAALARERPARVRMLVALLFADAPPEAEENEQARRALRAREMIQVLLSWNFRRPVVVSARERPGLRLRFTSELAEAPMLRCRGEDGLPGGSWEAVPQESGRERRSFRLASAPESCRYLEQAAPQELKFQLLRPGADPEGPLSSYEPLVLYFPR